MSVPTATDRSLLIRKDRDLIHRIIGLGDAVALLCARNEGMEDKCTALESLGGAIAEAARDIADRMRNAESFQTADEAS